MANEIELKEVVKLLNEAVAHHQAGEAKEAEAKYNETLSFEREFKFLLASDNQDLQDRKTLLRTVFSQAYNNLGVFREEEKNFGQAISSFRNAIDYAPGSVEAHTNIARVFNKVRNLDSALTLIRQALKLNPKYIPAIVQLSKVCYALGKPDEAIEAIKNIAPQLENNVRLNVEYGRLLEKSGDVIGAKERLLKALELDPDDNLANLTMGGVNLNLGKYLQALENYQTILKTNPRNIKATINIGIIQQITGRNDEALKAYKAALSLDPGNQEALSNYASFLEMTGDYKESLMVCDQLLKTPKLENRPLINANLIMAKCQRHLGNPEETLETLKALLEGLVGTPERARIYYELGLAYDVLGHHAKAISYFDRANTSFLVEAKVFENEKYQIIELIEKLQTSDIKSLIDGGYNLSTDKLDAPVFMVGFPIAGTDIPEKYLLSVPGFQILDNSSMMIGLRRRISRGRTYPECLKDISAGEASEWQNQYKKLVDQFAPGKAGRVTVNTSPFDFIELPLILKLFPNAKIVFVTMHPLDVVLNCYMKDFAANATNINFAKLDDTAAIFTASFDLWQKFKKELSFDFIEVRAEVLLSKPEKEMKKVLKFIDPEDKTGAVGILQAESLQKLSKTMANIYPVGRWEKYKKHLKGVKKTLGPVIKKLKY